MMREIFSRAFVAGTVVGLWYCLPSAMNAAEETAPKAEPVDFSSQIRPILSSKCFQCHGPDESSRKAKLRLDIRDEALKERKGVRAIVPGKLDESELVRRITEKDPDEIMPPPKTGKPLTREDIDLLKRWIQEGAPYTPHWAFLKPSRPSLPPVGAKSWSRNAIDYFILAKLEKNGLKPSPQADRHTLIRRATLDLTGLPPTLDEVDAFVRDRHSDAYEKLVDRLLGSPAYGERWARVWLDLARYADSAGYGSDPLRLNIWPWRDWLIDALNRNVPFDRFSTEMIAGDLLPSASQEQVIATGFHRNTMTNTEGGTDDEEFRVAAVKDRANTTAQVWMGLTLGCAQCHSHKFDPITQREYYQFFAFFDQTEDNDQPNEQPTLPLPNAEQRAQMEKFKTEIAELEKQRKKNTPESEGDLAQWEKGQKRPVDWTVLEPIQLQSSGGATLTNLSDGSILASGTSPETDTYIVKVRTDATNLTALRLELLPDESLPKNGPGRAETGKVVVNEFQLAVRSPKAENPRARFVRLELKGIHRILSLAEVQVISDGKNVAPDGAATQSTTEAEAAPQRAIDGNTDGNFEASSTTMTAAEDSPWWELDLGAEMPIDEIVIWNRTDRGLGTRMADFKALALDSKRKTAWEKTVGPAPMPVAFLRLAEEKSLKLQNASADYSEKDFGVAKAIDGSTDAKSGWSIGDRTGKAHAASFELESTNAPAESGALMIFTIAQKFGTNHTIGRFRISATAQPRPVRELPENLKEILAIESGERTEAQRNDLANYFRDFAPSLAKLNDELKQTRKKLDEIKPVALPIMREVVSEKRRKSHLLHKGNFLDPGENVEPGVPAAFNLDSSQTITNRLGLAQWLVNRENPLTARVAVNRLWARLFDRGIVETEEDFGTQGSLPSHRELLDWLAIEFMDKGWDTKAILKTILMSATYQQSSRVTPELLEKDPRNRLCSRGPRRRLDAEIVRDQALELSGLLSRKIGGPSVYPVQPDGLWRAAFNGERTWPTSKGQDRYRRGIYTFWRRTVPYPSMATFDAPSREICTVRRLPTNTPLQAFVTLNDPVFVEAAQALGRRLMREGGNSVSDRIRFGLRLCLVRPPNDDQIKALVELYEKELAHYRTHEDDAKKLATEPLGALPEGVKAAEAAAWTTVANVLLNMDGVLTKG